MAKPVVFSVTELAHFDASVHAALDWLRANLLLIEVKHRPKELYDNLAIYYSAWPTIAKNGGPKLLALFFVEDGWAREGLTLLRRAHSVLGET